MANEEPERREVEAGPRGREPAVDARPADDAVKPARKPRENVRSEEEGRAALEARLPEAIQKRQRLRQLTLRSYDLRDWLLAVVLSVIATAARFLEGYGGFLGEAFSSAGSALAIVGLFFLNAVVTVILLAILSAIAKPRRRLAYALIIVASFQTLVATDVDLKAVAGAEAAGQSEFNIGKFYGPMERGLSSAIDEPVEDAMNAELEQLVAAYPGRRGPQRFFDFITEQFRSEKTLDADARAVIRRGIRKVMADKDETPRGRIHRVGADLYRHEGRDIVQDAIARVS